MGWIVVRIWLVLSAFSEVFFSGLLILFLPFYEIYFMLIVSTNRTLRALWACTSLGALVVVLGGS